MKVRHTVACEWCKAPVPVGTRATRLHGRVWHYDCVDQYRALVAETRAGLKQP